MTTRRVPPSEARRNERLQRQREIQQNTAQLRGTAWRNHMQQLEEAITETIEVDGLTVFPPIETTVNPSNYPSNPEAVSNRVEINFGDTPDLARGTDRPPGWWRMRNQRWIRIQDMELSHLQNTVLMLQRSAHSRGRLPSSPAYEELTVELRRRQQNEESAAGAALFFGGTAAMVGPETTVGAGVSAETGFQLLTEQESRWVYMRIRSAIGGIFTSGSAAATVIPMLQRGQRRLIFNFLSANLRPWEYRQMEIHLNRLMDELCSQIMSERTRNSLVREERRGAFQQSLSPSGRALFNDMIRDVAEVVPIPQEADPFGQGWGFETRTVEPEPQLAPMPVGKRRIKTK